MATSTNFGWTEPDDTDLVKNGASAMRTLGNAIDSTLWTVSGFAAGKNKIINGDFYINQRNATSTTSNLGYIHDRWFLSTIADGTATYSTQAFTAGNPISGYEPTNYARIVTVGQSSSSTYTLLRSNNVEDVRTLAGQTVTFSFWAKAASGTPKLAIDLNQNFGSGGSASVSNFTSAITLSTTWTRYSATLTLASISGKTIGTGSNLSIQIWVSAGSTQGTAYTLIGGIQNNTFDIWGVQLEAGSTATPFQTATGTKQGELAACQRYYFRNIADASYGRFALGSATSTTAATLLLQPPVTMRTTPTSLDYSANIGLSDFVNTVTAVTSLTLSGQANKSCILIDAAVSSGLTQYRTYNLTANSSSTAYVGASAEL